MGRCQSASSPASEHRDFRRDQRARTGSCASGSDNDERSVYESSAVATRPSRAAHGTMFPPTWRRSQSDFSRNAEAIFIRLYGSWDPKRNILLCGHLFLSCSRTARCARPSGTVPKTLSPSPRLGPPGSPALSERGPRGSRAQHCSPALVGTAQPSSVPGGRGQEAHFQTVN